jgi:hypothetical protein
MLLVVVIILALLLLLARVGLRTGFSFRLYFLLRCCSSKDFLPALCDLNGVENAWTIRPMIS